MLRPISGLIRRASDPTGQFSQRPPDYPPPTPYGEHSNDILIQSATEPAHKGYRKWLVRQHAAFRKQHPDTPDTEDAFDCFLQKHNALPVITPDHLMDPFEPSSPHFHSNEQTRRQRIAETVAQFSPQEARLQLTVSQNRQRAYEWELENQPHAFQQREMNDLIRYEQEYQRQLTAKLRVASVRTQLQRLIMMLFMLALGQQLLRIQAVPEQPPQRTPLPEPTPLWPNSTLPNIGWPEI